MNDFMKKFAQFSLGPVVAGFIGIFTVLLTSYFILREDMGKVGMFTLMQTLMVSFVFVGLDQAYTREYHVEKNQRNLFFHALGIPLLLSVCFLLILSVTPYFFSYLLFGSREYPGVIILIGIFGVFITVERFVLLNLRMAEKAIEFSVFTIVLRILVLILTLVFVLFIRQDFLAVVYSMILGQMIGDVLLFVRNWKMFSLKGIGLDTRLLRRLLLFGLPLLVSVGIGSVLSGFDRTALRIWSDFEQQGIYAMSMKLMGVLLIFSHGFTTFWVPTAYRWYEEGKNTRDYKMVSDGILTVMALAFVGVLICRPVVVWILASEYSDVQFLLGFLSLWPIMLMLSETTTLGIVFSRKSYLNIFVSVITAIVTIGTNVLLVPRYGAVGAAAAMGISWVVFFFARTVFSFKVWEGFRITRHIIIVVLLVFLAFMNTREGFYVIIVNIASLPIILLINLDIVKLLYVKVKMQYKHRESK